MSIHSSSRGFSMTTTIRVGASVLLAMCLILSLGNLAFGQQAKAKQKGESKPPPALLNVAYGPHERNVLDVWMAKSEQPAPFLVFIHGGGFRGGSKEALQPYLLNGC